MAKPGDIQTPLLTLEQLQEKLDKPDAHLRASLVEEHTRAYFAQRGALIASGRIIIDEQSLLNQAYQFYQVATPDQKDTLVGFSTALLSIAVDESLKLTTMAAEAGAQQQSASAADATTKAMAARAFAHAIALRDQAVTVLTRVAAHDSAWTDRIDAAHANADVATALGALASTGDAMLDDKKSAVHARAALHSLTPRYLERLRAAAKDAASASSKHVGRRRSVTQGALDLEDGINLHVLGAIIDAFDAAHAIDPTIPRLEPISTRTILGSHHAHKTSQSAGSTAPAAAAKP